MKVELKKHLDGVGMDTEENFNNSPYKSHELLKLGEAYYDVDVNQLIVVFEDGVRKIDGKWYIEVEDRKIVLKGEQEFSI